MVSYLKAACAYVKDKLFEDLNDSDDEETGLAAIRRLSPASLNKPQQEAVGFITFVSSNQGCIDGQLYFPFHISEDELQVGDKVAYTVRITKGNGRLVENVRFIENNTEQDEDQSDRWQDAEDLPKECVTVAARERRIITLSNGVECNLDRVILKDDFLPIVGDSLAYYVNDLDQLVTLRPNQIVSGEGSIIELKNNGGIIVSSDTSSRIFFNFDALENGYEPVDGDVVKFCAIESTAGAKDECPLRCTSVVFEASKEPTEDYYQPLLNEGKLIIDGTSDFGPVIINSEPKKLSLHIYNPNDVAHTLKEVKFRRTQTQMVCESKTPFIIPPRAFENVDFSCRPNFCGRNHEVVDFIFDNCTVARRFEVDATATEISELLRNTIPSFMRQKDVKPTVVTTAEPRSRTYGPRPMMKKTFKRAGRYAIPKNITDVFISLDSETNATDAFSQCCPDLIKPLNSSNYALKFHTLLYIEELHIRTQVSRLSRSHVFFRRCDDMLVLDVPGLAEQRPSLVLNDQVIVTQPWSERDTTEHVGFIFRLSKEAIYVKFHDSFHVSYAGTDCEVRFEMTGGGFNHMHDAVVRASTRLGEAVLFPTKLSVNSPYIQMQNEFVWYNKSLNEGQRKAAISAMNAVCRPLPHIIFGPPGTGKTVTVVETVLQVMRICGDARIIVAAPSNSAADLLCQRLIYWGKLRPGEIARLMAFNRAQESFPEDLEPYCICGSSEDDEESGNISIGWHRITVGTCTSLARLHLYNFPPGFFTHVFIDEAGYATEPQTLIPLTLVSRGRGVAVLAGDPEQLGPVVMAHVAGKCGLGESFLARLIARFPYARDRDSFPLTQGFDPRLITRLTLNYRSVPEILALPNKLFYNSELQPTVTGKHGREAEIIQAFSKTQSIRDEPLTIMFHGVRGDNVQEPDSPSWLNPHELFETIQYIRLLYDMGVDASEVAVITPYRKQVQKIRQLLEGFDLEAPKVGSVEELQGQERQVVILSCVRSRATLMEHDRKFSLGFLSNPRRVNVAITRARCLLIVIGNPHLLQQDTHWRSLITYCIERNAYKGCDLPPALEPKSQR